MDSVISAIPEGKKDVNFSPENGIPPDQDYL